MDIAVRWGMLSWFYLINLDQSIYSFQISNRLKIHLKGSFKKQVVPDALWEPDCLVPHCLPNSLEGRA